MTTAGESSGKAGVACTSVLLEIEMIWRGEDGRLKRIEYRGRYLRASRTGGVAVRAQTKAAGLNLTVNSNRGVRVSARVAAGTQVALQDGRFVLRGRYGKGPTKLNLSKSGVSVSTRTDIGTVNWFRPRYSSAKIAGIQVRGKNALYLMAILALVKVGYALLVLVTQALVLSVQLVWWVALRISAALGGALTRQRLGRLERIETDWCGRLRPLSVEQLEDALDLAMLYLAKGKPLRVPEAGSVVTSPRGRMEQLVQALLSEGALGKVTRLEVLVSCLAEVYAEKVGERAALDAFNRLDAAMIREGGRNELQERLLAAYATEIGIEIV